MAELPPFGSRRAPGNLTYDFAPPRVAIPPLVLRRRRLLEKPRASWSSRLYWGPYCNLVLLGHALRLAAPTSVANSCGLAGPPHVGDVPVQVPGPGRAQHRALPGAQAALQLVQCRDGTHGSLIHMYIDVACYAVCTYRCASMHRYSSIRLPHYHMMHITVTLIVLCKTCYKTAP